MPGSLLLSKVLTVLPPQLDTWTQETALTYGKTLNLLPLSQENCRARKAFFLKKKLVPFMWQGTCVPIITNIEKLFPRIPPPSSSSGVISITPMNFVVETWLLDGTLIILGFGPTVNLHQIHWISFRSEFFKSFGRKVSQFLNSQTQQHCAFPRVSVVINVLLFSVATVVSSFPILSRPYMSSKADVRSLLILPHYFSLRFRWIRSTGYVRT